MFHGTSKQSLASIIKTGFMTAFDRQGTLPIDRQEISGRLWFARACSTSLGYSSKANGPVASCHASTLMMAEPSFIMYGHAMLLCRVLVSPEELTARGRITHLSGAICVGDPKMIITIDSNDMAYPEYVIHFQCQS